MTVKLLSERSVRYQKYGQACDKKVPKDMSLKLDNFV